MVIQLECAEAGALLLLLDFDQKVLNFFCMCLYGREPHDSRLRDWLLDNSQASGWLPPADPRLAAACLRQSTWTLHVGRSRAGLTLLLGWGRLAAGGRLSVCQLSSLPVAR